MAEGAELPNDARLGDVVSAAEPSHDALDSLGGEPGVVSFYGFENITIIVWHAKPTLSSVQHLARVSARRRAEFAHGISVVHLVLGTFEMPDTVTRDAFAKLLREGGGKLAVVCMVVGTGGFWASALRSLVTGLRVVTRGTFELGLHTDAREAVEYLQPRHLTQTGVAIDGELLSEELTKLFKLG